MPKSKHSPEFRAKVSQEYLDGIGSIQFLADKYSIGYSTLKGWINEYQIHGIAAFCHPSNKNRSRGNSHGTDDGGLEATPCSQER
ncbi:helix-turn-helix domain-containing protein [Blautia faecis]|uniref:helix-turn-helix domain-containing protein n=1 Tax=Blautia faecis TaxID=871665 RepID=UPI001D024CAE|nr:helix-turn-helix domain-containing protein [Blautia faecis]MCB5432736.1 helix-turn-helix domain containing protein [Blautia faecis]